MIKKVVKKFKAIKSTEEMKSFGDTINETISIDKLEKPSDTMEIQAIIVIITEKMQELADTTININLNQKKINTEEINNENKMIQLPGRNQNKLSIFIGNSKNNKIVGINEGKKAKKIRSKQEIKTEKINQAMTAIDECEAEITALNKKIDKIRINSGDRKTIIKTTKQKISQLKIDPIIKNIVKNDIDKLDINNEKKLKKQLNDLIKKIHPDQHPLFQTEDYDEISKLATEFRNKMKAANKDNNGSDDEMISQPTIKFYLMTLEKLKTIWLRFKQSYQDDLTAIQNDTEGSGIIYQSYALELQQNEIAELEKEQQEIKRQQQTLKQERQELKQQQKIDNAALKNDMDDLAKMFEERMNNLMSLKDDNLNTSVESSSNPPREDNEIQLKNINEDDKPPALTLTPT